MASKYVVQAEEPNRTQSNKYLDATGHWTVPAGGGGGGASSLADLDDVSLTNVQDGETLVYDASSQKFINAERTGGASSLEDLDDVQLTTPTDGQALVYDSELQKFINGDVADPQVFDTDNNGLAPASGDDDETKFLRNDGEWAEPVEKITPEYYYAHKEELEASGKSYMVSGTIIGTIDAEHIGYDNTTSGLTSTNLQDAVDELAQGGGSDEREMISDAWSPLTAYAVGRYAIDENKLYKCLAANTNMQPSTNPTYWSETNVVDEIKAFKDSLTPLKYINRTQLVRANSSYQENLSNGCYLYTSITNTVVIAYWIIIEPSVGSSVAVKITANFSNIMVPTVSNNKLTVANNNAYDRYFSLLKLTEY